MRCTSPACQAYFCYLCAADLGDDNGRAHGAHYTSKRGDAAGCWMFDGGEYTPEARPPARSHIT